MSGNLEIKMEAEKLAELYKSDPRSNSYTAVIYGGLGTGKTSLLRTCRLPLHVDSFDPGGSKVLKGEAILNGKLYSDEMSKGNIIVDASFEKEDPFNPTVADLWQEKFNHRGHMGYYDRLGTYAIDSMTTWAQAIMYKVIKEAGRAGGYPFKQDWMPQMSKIENAIKSLLSLDCDIILLGHSAADKDETTGQMFVSLDVTGKLSKRVPLLFDEIYMTTTSETSKGVDYRLLTKATGLFTARSRLCTRGQIETYEPADIKAILKKAGLPTEDKPSMFSE